MLPIEFVPRTFTGKIRINNYNAKFGKPLKHTPPTQSQNPPPIGYVAKVSETSSPAIKLKVKIKRTVTFSASDSPADDVVSYVTGNQSFIPPRTQRGSITIQTNTYTQNKADAIAKPNIRLPPPTGPNGSNIQFDDGAPDVASFFRKPTYSVRI